MAITLNQNTDCCETTCSTTSTTNVAGPTGAAGAAGSNGTNGSNAYTTTTASFTMPAVSSTVVVAVSDSGWMSVGQALYVSGGGYFEVTVIASAISITLKNLYAVPTNAADGATVADASTVSAAGVKGDTGTAGSAGSGLPPLATGGLATYSNQNIALAVGGHGTFLMANSNEVAGLEWTNVTYDDLDGTLELDTVTTSGQLSLDKLANDTTNPDDGDILYWDDNAATWVKLPKGSTGQRLEQGASAPQWVTAANSNVGVGAMGRIRYTQPCNDSGGAGASVSLEGGVNCGTATTSVTGLITVPFTVNLSRVRPIVQLTPIKSNVGSVHLYMDEDSNTAQTTQLKVQLPIESYVGVTLNLVDTWEFDFIVFD